MLKNKIYILLCLTFLLNSSIFTSARSAGVVSLSSQTESAQSLTVAALASALTFLAQGDKKNAIAQVKIALKNLRKIPTLPKVQVNGMTVRLNKAITAIKRDQLTAAREQISHVHDELAV